MGNEASYTKLNKKKWYQLCQLKQLICIQKSRKNKFEDRYIFHI